MIFFTLAKEGLYKKEIAKILHISGERITSILIKNKLKWSDIVTEKQKERYSKALSESNKGLKRSQEMKEKYRLSKLGEKNSMFGRKGKLHPLYGTKKSLDHRKKLSLAHIGLQAGNKHPLYKNIDINQVILLAKENYNQKEICKKLNISLSVVRNRLKENNIKWPEISNYRNSEKYLKKLSKSHIGKIKGVSHRQYINISIMKIIELAKQNYTQNEIALYFDVYAGTIKKRLDENNIKWSDISNYMKSEKRSLNCRKAKIKFMEKTNFIHPSFNPKACEFFNFLNFHLGWKGIYAKNGSEFYIKELGYWVDYYEANLNLVIEYDEKDHYNSAGTLKPKDIQRQKEITEFLGCKFIRIKEEKNMNYPNIVNNIVNELLVN